MSLRDPVPPAAFHFPIPPTLPLTIRPVADVMRRASKHIHRNSTRAKLQWQDAPTLQIRITRRSLRLHSRNSQTSKTDNTRAQQGCDVQIIQRLRQRIHKIRPRHRILRIAAIHAVSRECRRVAKVLFFIAAIPACTIHTPHPGHPTRIPQAISGGPGNYFTDNLMPGISAWRNGGNSRSRICKSVRHTPQARTRSSTCPGSACGFATSSIRKGRSAIFPKECSTAAFIPLG